MEDAIQPGQGVFVTGAEKTVFRFEGRARDGFVTISGSGGFTCDVPEDCIQAVKKRTRKEFGNIDFHRD